MPAIRDYSFQTTTVATGTTLTIPIPAYEVGDLLIALLVADTGTATVSSSGWTEYVRSTNTVQSIVMYKIAAAGDSDPTFTWSASESFHGVIISIKDVDTSSPFNGGASKNTSAAIDTFPTVTTNRDNCLVLFFDAHSGTGTVPSIITGPVVGLYAVDGLAESSGTGWYVQGIAGTTPSTVKTAALSAAAQLMRTIAINPPSVGAAYVPTYCSNDNSIYLNPLHGTTTFSGDTSAAQDPTTVFGTSLLGRTITSDVCTAVTDYGLNSFHSTARITADSTNPLTWRASMITFNAFKYNGGNARNLSNKLLCVHTGPSTPGQYQRIRNIASPSGNGIAIGLASSTSNWKIWHVHGANTPFGFSRDVPCLIHPNNTLGVIQSSGSFNSSSVTGVAFFVSVIPTTATSAWDFYSMWGLDEITLCGGNTGQTMGINGIVGAIQGKEHRGVIQQGENQMISYMPIRFGNSGVNPINMGLDSTAIEFGKFYSLDDKLVNYCSVDSFAGISYCPGSGDIINHTNSIISSDDPYYWRIEPGASGTPYATYSFDGLSIIGALPCTLRNVTTYSNMSFSNCGQINATGCTLQDVTIGTSRSGQISALKITPSTSLTNVSLTTTNTGYYGIELPVSGSYNFDNVLFNGFGNNKELYVSSLSGALTVNILNAGDIPGYTITGGSTSTVSVLASANLTFTGLVTGSEVRAYVGLPPSNNEIGGIESSETFFTVTHSVPGSGGYVIIHSLGYVPMEIDLTYSSSEQTLPISQQIDRVYENPV